MGRAGDGSENHSRNIPFLFPWVSNHGLQNSEKNLAFFEVSGKDFGYFGDMLVDFWGRFILF